MKRSKDYYFKEAGLTLRLTAQQYLSLKQQFLDLAVRWQLRGFKDSDQLLRHRANRASCRLAIRLHR